MSGAFRTTRWSMVAAAAARGGDARDARRALSELCEAYWLPIYAYARASGDDEETARDLTQEFFAALLEKNYVADADATRGRFRTFLIASFKNHRSKVRARQNASKRGGGHVVVPLDIEKGECRLAADLPADPSGGPERAFERRWALTLLARALADVEASYAARGKAELFEALRPSIEGEGGSHASTAARLGMTVSAVKVAVHRLRSRYREALRREVAHTVGLNEGDEGVLDEIRHLIGAVSR